MRKILLHCLILTLALAASGLAAELCPTGTAVQYLALGACQVGDKVFSNFSIVPVGGDLEDISIAPISTGDLGLDINPAIFVSEDDTEDVQVGFTVTAPGPTITSLHLFSNGAVSGGGTAWVHEVYCLGSTTISGCATEDLGVLDVHGTGSDSATFAGVTGDHRVEGHSR
jgi:hypothetical protein